MTYGPSDSLVEFLHIDNLVQAHLKAGKALATAEGAKAVSAVILFKVRLW